MTVYRCESETVVFEKIRKAEWFLVHTVTELVPESQTRSKALEAVRLAVTECVAEVARERGVNVPAGSEVGTRWVV